MIKRKLKSSIRENLESSELFIDKLKGDILSGEIFPAIRENKVHFYHKGGRLFGFEKSFETHIKYASIYNHGKKKEYISEQDLLSIKPIKNFSNGYDKIKENCSLHSGVESEGISKLLKKYSYAKPTSEDVVVLDIEIAFSLPKNENQKNRNRIDILLYNRQNNELCFVEAKHFSNSELWSKEGIKPKVVEQIEKYRKQIGKSTREILEAYSNYIRTINQLYDLSYDIPNTVNREVPLLIFGFDRDQLQGRFKKLIKEDQSLENIKYFSIGNISGIDLKNVWNKWFRN